MNVSSKSTRLASEADQRRVAELAVRYGGAVQRFFARRVRDRSSVEELTQEVFARLLRRAELDAIENIEGYIFHTAANLLREQARQQAHRRASANDPLAGEFSAPHEEFSPERILLGKEAWARTVEALQELPERARTIFVLNRFEELSAVEIARRLGVSVSTVEKDMMRAVAHLRARLT